MVKYKYVVLYGDKGVSKEFDTPVRAELYARMKKSKGFKGQLDIDKIDDKTGSQSHYKRIQGKTQRELYAKIQRKISSRNNKIGSSNWVAKETRLFK